MLSKGEIQFSGNIDQTVIEYLKGFRISGSGATINLAKHEGRRPNRPVLFQKAQLIVNGDIGDVAKVGDSLEIKLWIDSGKDLKGNNVWVVVENDLTQRIFSVSTKYVNRQLLDSAGRKTIVSCYIPKLPLLPGDYYLSVFIGDDKHPGDAIDYAMRSSVQRFHCGLRRWQ